ncbi:EscN/YscN/HrcN family type III secretion system ATPase, partial [Massilia sp. CT11-108]
MNDAIAFLDALGGALDAAETVVRHGKVVEAVGTLLKVGGIDVMLGELCELRDARGTLLQRAEVVGFTRQFALLAPFG